VRDSGVHRQGSSPPASMPLYSNLAPSSSQVATPSRSHDTLPSYPPPHPPLLHLRRRLLCLARTCPQCVPNTRGGGQRRAPVARAVSDRVFSTPEQETRALQQYNPRERHATEAQGTRRRHACSCVCGARATHDIPLSLHTISRSLYTRYPALSTHDIPLSLHTISRVHTHNMQP
jgi:hypothetical protein